MIRQHYLLIILVLLAMSSLFFSLTKGSVLIPIHEIANQNNTFINDIIFSIRLPRLLSAFVTGGLLALSGALMQILLRNPLADPYVLGISGGAAVSTLLLILFGVSGIYLAIGSWLGSLSVATLIFVIAKPNFNWNTQRVLLTGVALAAGLGALISFILLISPEHELRGMLFWLVGDLSDAPYPGFESIILLLGLIMSAGLSRELTLLMRGDLEAASLGINTKKLSLFLYCLTSLLTATAVSLSGCIGFIGLIVPHALRLIGFQKLIFLFPACVLLGGSLLTFADLFARIALPPAEIPVGIVMTLIGIPVFLLLLQRN